MQVSKDERLHVIRRGGRLASVIDKIYNVGMDLVLYDGLITVPHSVLRVADLHRFQTTRLFALRRTRRVVVYFRDVPDSTRPSPFKTTVRFEPCC